MFPTPIYDHLFCLVFLQRGLGQHYGNREKANEGNLQSKIQHDIKYDQRCAVNLSILYSIKNNNNNALFIKRTFQGAQMRCTMHDYYILIFVVGIFENKWSALSLPSMNLRAHS
jgi:hypothetical protein